MTNPHRTRLSQLWAEATLAQAEADQNDGLTSVTSTDEAQSTPEPNYDEGIQDANKAYQRAGAPVSL